MMHSNELRISDDQALPDLRNLNPLMMTASELRENLRCIFDWLDAVEVKGNESGYTAAAVQRVRDAANLLLNEQRERHSDESAPRGG